MRAERAVAVAVLGLVAALSLVGCGSGGGHSTAGAADKPAAVSDPNGGPVAAPTDGTAGARSGLDESGAGTTGAGQPGSGQPSSGQASNGQPGSGQASSGQASNGQGQPVSASSPRSMVRSAQLSIEVADVYDAARRAGEVATSRGGFVASESTERDGATVEVKVAADQLDAALAALSELGTKVLSRGQQARDVTEQLVDLDSRVASQRASVARLQALLDRAGGIGEIVQIEGELTRRQADLESVERRAAALNGQVELATVAVRMTRTGAAAATERDRDGFLAGLRGGWRVFLAGVQLLLAAAGAMLPFLAMLAVPAAVVGWLLRRRRAAAGSPAPAVPVGHPGAE
jgi:hypothetical protein